MKKYKIGMVQVNNSFSGQNYLPLSLGFLVSYAEFHCKNYNDFDFLNPIYKRVPIKEAVEQYKDCDIVAFSVYVWNNNISMRIAKALKEVNPNILTLAGGCHIPERPEYIEAGASILSGLKKDEAYPFSSIFLASLFFLPRPGSTIITSHVGFECA